MSILINVCLGLFVLVALLMVLVILMQRPKSEGLGAAFGAAVTENIFGAQTTNVLVKITGWLAGIFFALTFALSVLYAHKSVSQSGLRRELEKQSAAQPTPSPAAALISPSPAAATSPSPAGPNSPLPASPHSSQPAVSPAMPPAAASPVATLAPEASQSPTSEASASPATSVASPSATIKSRRKR